jgi:maltooligosyltrehalose trehalohydrolase
MEIGAIYQDHHQCQFVVWAPFLQSIELRLTSPREQRVPLVKEEQGYWRVTLNNIRFIYVTKN